MKSGSSVMDFFRLLVAIRVGCVEDIAECFSYVVILDGKVQEYLPRFKVFVEDSKVSHVSPGVLSCEHEEVVAFVE
jgi:hypothetical protein